MIKLLDCTLRDGGYYTNWDFDKTLVDQYVAAMEALPVSYLELGYRSLPQKGYYGEYFYSPVDRLKALKEMAPNTGFALMIDEKNADPQVIPQLFKPLQGICEMVRMAVAPNKIADAIVLAQILKDLGFLVAVNIMYISKIKLEARFFDQVNQGEGFVDFLYLVDSYGGIMPKEVGEKIRMAKENTPFTIGFHGHNNMELALANSYTAMQNGAGMIDATVTGMGRGAGNLKTELILTYLQAQLDWRVDFSQLSHILPFFEEMQRNYGWGTNLPYMISGAYSLPQKDVMDWMGKRRYTINGIVQAMTQSQQKPSQAYPNSSTFNIPKPSGVLIVGGGQSVATHLPQIRRVLAANPDWLVIHCSTRNMAYFTQLANPQVVCLTGQEGKKMQKRLNEVAELNLLACVLPPSPRKMGAFVPPALENKIMELEGYSFEHSYPDGPLALALQMAWNSGSNYVGLIGMDGYQQTLHTDFELRTESQVVLDAFGKSYVGKWEALTPTGYQMPQGSIYTLA
ncbi:aldolase catalytic domain-containing protein [Algoriphagus limi]|uniref:Aldolase catalytic domain-containing protein n=1 Tax=Algoriphagus limi TaxID=2975273 RepID=A0ABT2G1N0_9BACT|nr:aldolase catalytic domain-containing protein [Algoriphagus limi]MCS5489178.1 aldolase catalytic domain-containing protein [Algoriphagus limi]